MLEASGVTKRFGGMCAVADVSFAVDLDGITGLIGPNGAGKTTMFNLLAGSLAATSGTIRFNGLRLNRLRADHRAGPGPVLTFQIPRQLAAMSVSENPLLSAQRQSGDPRWTH